MTQIDKSLRATMEQLSTAQLDELLQAELKKEIPDDHRVRLILGVIRDRESDCPVEITEKAAAAWKKYRQNIAGLEAFNTRKTVKRKNWYISIAAVAAVICIVILAMPRSANAEGVFGRFVRWTESVFELFVPTSTPKQYVFRTEHPGLQQLYDTVVGLGVTQPAVPMWLPEGATLKELKVREDPVKTMVHTLFIVGQEPVMISYYVYNVEKSSGYAKDNENVEIIEIMGIEHSLLGNDGTWTALWEVGNVECTISTHNKDDVRKILLSIYNEE